MADILKIEPVLLTEKQAAIYTSTHPRQWANDRAAAKANGTKPRIPYVRLGRQIRYRKSDLDELIISNLIGGGE